MDRSVVVTLDKVSSFSELLNFLRSRCVEVTGRVDPGSENEEKIIFLAMINEVFPISRKQNSSRISTGHKIWDCLVLIVKGLTEDAVVTEKYRLVLVGNVADKVSRLLPKKGNIIAILDPRCKKSGFGMKNLEVGPIEACVFYCPKSKNLLCAPESSRTNEGEAPLLTKPVKTNPSKLELCKRKTDCLDSWYRSNSSYKRSNEVMSGCSIGRTRERAEAEHSSSHGSQSAACRVETSGWLSSRPITARPTTDTCHSCRPTTDTYHSCRSMTGSCQSGRQTTIPCQSCRPTTTPCQSCRPTVDTSHSCRPTKDTCQSCRPTTVTCQPCKPTTVTCQSCKPTTVTCQSCKPTTVTCQSCKPTTVTCQSCKPTTVTCQSCKPTMVTCKSCKPTTVTCQSCKPTTVTCQSCKPTTVTCQSCKPTTDTCQSCKPNTVTCQSYRARMDTCQLYRARMDTYQSCGPTTTTYHSCGPPRAGTPSQHERSTVVCNARVDTCSSIGSCRCHSGGREEVSDGRCPTRAPRHDDHDFKRPAGADNSSQTRTERSHRPTPSRPDIAENDFTFNKAPKIFGKTSTEERNDSERSFSGNCRPETSTPILRAEINERVSSVAAWVEANRKEIEIPSDRRSEDLPGPSQGGQKDVVIVLSEEEDERSEGEVLLHQLRIIMDKVNKPKLLEQTCRLVSQADRILKRGMLIEKSVGNSGSLEVKKKRKLFTQPDTSDVFLGSQISSARRSDRSDPISNRMKWRNREDSDKTDSLSTSARVAPASVSSFDMPLPEGNYESVLSVPSRETDSKLEEPEFVSQQTNMTQTLIDMSVCSTVPTRSHKKFAKKPNAYRCQNRVAEEESRREDSERTKKDLIPNPTQELEKALDTQKASGTEPKLLGVNESENSSEPVDTLENETRSAKELKVEKGLEKSEQVNDKSADSRNAKIFEECLTESSPNVFLDAGTPTAVQNSGNQEDRVENLTQEIHIPLLISRELAKAAVVEGTPVTTDTAAQNVSKDCQGLKTVTEDKVEESGSRVGAVEDSAKHVEGALTNAETPHPSPQTSESTDQDAKSLPKETQDVNNGREGVEENKKTDEEVDSEDEENLMLLVQNLFKPINLLTQESNSQKTEGGEEEEGWSPSVVSIRTKFILKANIMKITPQNLEGDKIFDLVSGQCLTCNHLSPYSKLIDRKMGMTVKDCPFCSKRGKTSLVVLKYLFKIYIRDVKATQSVLAVDKAAEKFMGISAKDFISERNIAHEHRKLIQKIVKPSKKKSTEIAFLFYVSLKKYQTKTIPVLCDIRPTLKNVF